MKYTVRYGVDSFGRHDVLSMYIMEEATRVFDNLDEAWAFANECTELYTSMLQYVPETSEEKWKEILGGKTFEEWFELHKDNPKYIRTYGC